MRSQDRRALPHGRRASSALLGVQIAKGEIAVSTDPKKKVLMGNASWQRGDGLVRCGVEGLAPSFNWYVVSMLDRRRKDGTAKTFFLALRAAQRAADLLEG